MDTNDARGMTKQRRPLRRREADRLAMAAMAVFLIGAVFAAARPAVAAGLLPEASLPVDVPSLPVELPSVALPDPTVVVPTLPPTPHPTPRPTPRPTLPPLPTLPPVPSLPLPSLPTPSLPTPSFPTPSVPAPSLPTPSLPTPTQSPRGSSSPSPAAASATSLPGAGGPIGSGTTASEAGPEDDASGRSPVPADPGQPSDVAAGPLDGIVLPGLLIGVPAVLVIAAVIAQLAVGAAWLPVIRRWLHRRFV